MSGAETDLVGDLAGDLLPDTPGGDLIDVQGLPELGEPEFTTLPLTDELPTGDLPVELPVEELPTGDLPVDLVGDALGGDTLGALPETPADELPLDLVGDAVGSGTGHAHTDWVHS
jgi:hypothetical protein